MKTEDEIKKKLRLVELDVPKDAWEDAYKRGYRRALIDILEREEKYEKI